MKRALLITCEHGGHRVPARARAALAPAARVLRTHRGWDPGALALARGLARELDAPLLACTTSRLVVDANRSRRHPRLFSEWTRALARAERDALVARWWTPHRTAVEDFVRRRRAVLHLSIHTFTPRWKGGARAVDVGFLYDPARPAERAFALRWRAALAARESDLRLRSNQPYRGTADGLTATMRDRFEERRYLGLELEVSQRFSLGDAARWRTLRRAVGDALRESLERA